MSFQEAFERFFKQYVLMFNVVFRTLFLILPTNIKDELLKAFL